MWIMFGMAHKILTMALWSLLCAETSLVGGVMGSFVFHAYFDFHGQYSSEARPTKVLTILTILVAIVIDAYVPKLTLVATFCDNFLSSHWLSLLAWLEKIGHDLIPEWAISCPPIVIQASIEQGLTTSWWMKTEIAGYPQGQSKTCPQECDCHSSRAMPISKFGLFFWCISPH